MLYLLFYFLLCLWKQIRLSYAENHYLFFILEKFKWLAREGRALFWKRCKSFYGFVPLFDVLSTGNALRLIDHSFDKIEFLDIHYYVEYFCFLFLYLCEMITLEDSLVLHREVHIRCWCTINDFFGISDLLIIFVTFVP